MALIGCMGRAGIRVGDVLPTYWLKVKDRLGGRVCGIFRPEVVARAPRERSDTFHSDRASAFPDTGRSSAYFREI